MDSITPIWIEWNAWNGFIFKVLEIELKKYNARSLFSLDISPNFLYVNLLFLRFKIFDKTDD